MPQALLCAQGKIKNSWDVLLALHIFFSSYDDLPFTVVITVSLEIAWAIYILIVYQKAFPNYLSYPLHTSANHDTGDVGPHLSLHKL